MKMYFLKCDYKFFRLIKQRLKNVEIRNNDRDFQKGHIYALLQSSNEEKKYLGEIIIIKILWVNTNYEGLKEGYCMFGFKILYEGYLHDLRDINFKE